MRLALVFALVTTAASAQFQIQDAHTTASLRGIHSLGGGVAWASGTGGTVLRTEDGGFVWQLCAIPPGAEELDFRGIQAFDHNTAIVMSSGKGDLSRLYKTTDGCQTWKLMMTNDEPEGFWDSLQMWNQNDGFLAGDPVDGKLFLAESSQYVKDFVDDLSWLLKMKGPGEAAFAASNSALALGPFTTKDGEARSVWFATGGPSGSRVIHFQHFNGGEPERLSTTFVDVPSFPKAESAGIFSIKFATPKIGVAVGGDYVKPNDSTGTAAFSKNEGKIWMAAKTPPHGYRSSVAYDPTHKTWITVGPNGTDISTDDGRNWRPLKPSSLDTPDADQQWNALSLPYVVGPHGRIGRLREDALK